MSIETRLDRLEEARGDERPTMVIYETDVELSREDEAAFLKVTVPNIHPNALVVAERQPEGSGPAEPRLIDRGAEIGLP